VKLLDGLGSVIYNFSFYNHNHKHQTRRGDMTYFCEHDGICINFTPVRHTWHALAPCALKPWWLFLKTARQNKQKNNKQETEVTQNA